MATLTPVKLLNTGVLQTLTAAAAGGDQFANRGKTFFVVTNVSGGPETLTFDSPAIDKFGVGPDASHDIAVVVATATTVYIGPFSSARFNDSNGNVQVTYTSETGITVNPFEFPAVD